MKLDILSEHEVHTRSLAFLCRSPDISAVILDDLLHDRKSDAAAALRGIAGRIRAVKPLKYLAQILLRDSLSVILDLDPDGFREEG